MLDFNRQYDIANGIFLTYDTQLDYRLLHSKHKGKTRENVKNSFPYQRWESKTRELFVLACMYTIFTKTPSSFRGFLSELREIDMKEVAKFKHKILNYEDYLKKDIRYLLEQFGSSITPEIVLKELMKDNIQFFTAYWYLYFDKSGFTAGRTFSHVMRKIKFLMLFLTFKEESVQNIKVLFEQIEL